TKVAVAESGGWNGEKIIGDDGVFIELLEIKEEEALVGPIVKFAELYRPTESPTVIVAPLQWTNVLAAAVVAPRQSGIQGFIGEEVVRTCVKLVGTGFHREIQQPTADLAEFSRK